jgi:hypothetical protein
VTEQSHKTEMANALRGDFDRLRARGVESTLDPSPGVPAAEAVQAGDPAPRTAGLPVQEVGGERVAPTGSWLGRLFDRR